MIQNTNTERLLTAKELAFALRRNPNYIYKLTCLGFRMPGGTATLSEARAFIASNGRPFGKNNRIRKRSELGVNVCIQKVDT